jgi:hypothetical protein
MDTIMNEKESLELITRMIDNTRKGIEKNAALPMLVFGYTSIVTTLAVWFAVTKTENYMFHLLWIAIPVIGWLIYGLLGNARTRKDGVSQSHMGSLIGRMWVFLAGIMMLCMFPAFLLRGFPAPFIMTLLAAIGVSCTGLLVRYAPLIICGLLGVLTSFVLLWVTGITSMVVLAFAFAVMMVLPGHILHNAAVKIHRNDA